MTGYETHDFYRGIATQSKNRLYLFGRKNRKIFDREYLDFWRSVGNNPGFDLRILFLNPNSETVNNAHADNDFRGQLELAISEAKKNLTDFGIDYDSVCRFYDCKREYGVTVSDDTVFVAKIPHKNGVPEKTTGIDFDEYSLFDVEGEKYINIFLSAWLTGRA